MSAAIRYVFLGGLHRSGTSLLYRCLGEHPDISIFRDTGVPEDEGMFLQSVYEPASAYGGPGRFGFDPKAHLTEESKLVNQDTRQRMKREWGAHWDSEKSLLAEKSPPNILRTRFLQAIFDDAGFIIVLRHPLATSYATKKWSKTGIRSLLRHWLRCHEMFDVDRRYLQKLWVVKYEDLVANPERELGKIWRFLGVQEIAADVEMRRGINDEYFAYWSRMRSRPLTALYTTTLIRLYEKRVNHFGYSLRDVGLRNPY